jgi:hypothetical protein
MYDIRRTDLRDSVYASPYWITSGKVIGADVKDASVCFFSFPVAGRITVIHEVVFQVTTGFTAGTTGTIGSGTLATDLITTGGVLTNVDVDEYVLAADITLTAEGYYGPVTAHTSDWLTQVAAGSYTAPRFIVGAATTVPVVYAVITNAGAIAAGVGVLHMLISNIPGK